MVKVKVKVKVTVMHIYTQNFSQTVTDRTSITIVNKYKVSYTLSIGIFTFHLDPF